MQESPQAVATQQQLLQCYLMGQLWQSMKCPLNVIFQIKRLRKHAHVSLNKKSHFEVVWSWCLQEDQRCKHETELETGVCIMLRETVMAESFSNVDNVNGANLSWSMEEEDLQTEHWTRQSAVKSGTCWCWYWLSCPPPPPSLIIWTVLQTCLMLPDSY